MTNWNKYGSLLEITHQYVNILDEFLETLPKNVDAEPLWEIENEEWEITPISYRTDRPENYIKGYIEIVKWLKKKRLNCQSGYAFTYQDDENPDDRLVGCFNSNNEGITVCQIDGEGKVTQEFHKI